MREKIEVNYVTNIVKIYKYYYDKIRNLYQYK